MLSDNDSFISAIDCTSLSDSDSFCSISETLGDTLRQNFNISSNQLLNVCHINAQSIPSHYNDLLEAFCGTNVHAILISESWFKPHLLSTSYSLPGFILIRNDRVDKRGGGVAIYLRSDLPYTVVKQSSHNSYTAEYLFLEVRVKGVKTILGVVYCPPSVDYFSDLESALESLGSEYVHHIIMGDFNTDLLTPTSPRTLKLQNIIKSMGLHILPLHATHHNPNVDTWLDLMLISSLSLIATHGQCSAPGFSRHDAIFVSYILKPPKAKPKILHLRSFARIDVDQLREDASTIDWRSLLAATSMDEKVRLFNMKVINLFNIHAPIKKIKLKRSPAPWMTEDIKL